MRYALVNPNWTFEKSIYFGCRDRHFPVEFGYAQAILEDRGHEAFLFDAHLNDWSNHELKAHLQSFRPDYVVVSTAPTYLFWRCPPPELRVPMQTCADLRDSSEILIAVGPHVSTTPLSALKKLGADLALLGEFESVLPRIAGLCRKSWKDLPYAVCAGGGEHGNRQACVSDLDLLPSIRWPDELIRLHRHHHHRFDSASSEGPGAEMETSRGCPYHCTFCARGAFRGRYRKRPLRKVFEEMDRLIRQGVTYFYFIDEIFLPDPVMMDALAARAISFGIQTRIDLWPPDMLDRLGEAGCVSIEAGLEGATPRARLAYGKRDLTDHRQIMERLVRAKKTIPFVQATLLDSVIENSRAVAAWRAGLLAEGVWVNEPVPVFPYPGSMEYENRWGPPDELAWERAHAWYLEVNKVFSDIQDSRPLSLNALERS